MTVHNARLGLTLTRCDCCNRRQFCAVDGVAMCGDCCPGAVQFAREEAETALEAKRRARQAEHDRIYEALPGEDVGPPVPYSQVAHLF